MIEIAKLSDRNWRLNNLYKIQNIDGDRVTFVMNAVQRDFDKNMWWLNLVLKSRQHGITTYACIRGLDMALFRPGARVGIVAHTREDATKFFRGKILYAYDNLPESLRKAIPIVRRDMNGTLELANGSIIEVSVSHRSGTMQYLHVSEYGPMCAMSPQRADEVKAGALNTIHKGGIVTVESTAYGREGDFYERTKRAIALHDLVGAGTKNLTRMDYRFFFYAWFSDPKNVLDEEVHIDAAFDKYFYEVEAKLDITLANNQKWWYIKKDEEQGDKMNQEHPSTPEEAFNARQDAQYYSRELARARKSGRITKVPIIPSIPVNTFWDLGRNDANAIWLHQRIGAENRFIAYFQDSGEDISYYARWLIDFKNEHKIIFDTHYLPHDGEVVELTRADGLSREGVLNGLGVNPTVIVDRIPELGEGIDAVRRIFPSCWFDEDACKDGITALENYKKKWNSQVQSFQDTPLKNDARNGADAFRQFAQGYEYVDNKPVKVKKRKKGSWKAA